MEAPGPVGSDTEAIIHSDRLALIDHGRIVGFFESNDREALDVLVARARRFALPRWVTWLPSVNASLNGLSACLLLAGWIMIRRYRATVEGRIGGPDRRAGPSSRDLDRASRARAYRLHARGSSARPHCSWSAISSITSGPAACRSAQGGLMRVAYLSILLSHTVLATASVPLILITVRRGWRGELDRHTTIAGVTFPIWLYVAVTGVVIYLLLYHLPALPNGGVSRALIPLRLVEDPSGSPRVSNTTTMARPENRFLALLNSPRDRPLIVAHRGDSFHAPRTPSKPPAWAGKPAPMPGSSTSS